MKSITFILYCSPFLLFGCANEGENNNTSKNGIRSHYELMNLKGKVKSIKEYSFIAIEQDGEIIKGDKEKGYNSDVDYVEFNNFGNVIKGVNYETESNPGVKWVNTCNEEGNITEHLIYTQDDHLNAKTIYKYDSEENLVEEIGYNDNDSILYKSVSEFDKNGFLVIGYSYNSEDSLKGKRLYKYDAKGNMIEEKAYAPNGKVYWWETHKYNKTGNEIERIKSYSSSTTNTHLTFKYDKNNNIIEEKLSNDWIEKFEYVYDNQLNWIRKTILKNNIPTYIIEREIEYFE